MRIPTSTWPNRFVKIASADWVPGFVVDASVVHKWLVLSPSSARAIQVLESADVLLAPDLLISELGNSIWKLRLLDRRQPAEVPPDRIHAWVLGLPLDIRPSKDLLKEAMAVAYRYSRSVYDSVYVALSVASALPLITADRKLARALAGTRIGSQVVYLDDFDPLAWS